MQNSFQIYTIIKLNVILSLYSTMAGRSSNSRMYIHIYIAVEIIGTQFYYAALQ